MEYIEIVDRVLLQLSYLHFLASNRQRQQIESSYSCPIYTSQHRIDRDRRQSLLTVVLFALLGIEQIEIVDRVFLQLSYLHFLSSNRQRQQIESSYSCPFYISQRQLQIESSYSCPICTSCHRSRQRQLQIESSYSCPFYISQHRIDRDRRQSLLTVVLFALLGIEQIDICKIESSYSCPIYTSQHRIDRDRRQSLLTVVLFALLGIRIDRDSRQSLLTVVLFALLVIEQIETTVDRVFLQLSFLYFLASNRQRSQIESSYSCPIYTSQHRIDKGQQIESSYSCPICTSWHRIDRDLQIESSYSLYLFDSKQWNIQRTVRQSLSTDLYLFDF